MNPTYQFFGEQPTTLVLKTTNAFNGTQHLMAAAPTVQPGVMNLAAEANGGLYNFHQYPIKVHFIEVKGGSITMVRSFKQLDGTYADSGTLATLTETAPYATPFILGPGEALKFSGGAANSQIAITAQLARDKVVN